MAASPFNVCIVFSGINSLGKANVYTTYSESYPNKHKGCCHPGVQYLEGTLALFLHAHTQGQLNEGLITKLEHQGKPMSVWFDLMLRLLESSELQGDLSHILETSVSFTLF